MTVGSSTGEHFEDELHAGTAYFVDNQQSVKEPDATSDQNVITPQQLEKSQKTNSDPKNIYDDQGNIVDYDFWGTGPRKPESTPTPEGQPDSKYNTPLSPLEESIFSHWKQRVAPNDSGEDYDLRGAFKAGAEPSENGHWPDTWKKPNHPTFSDQSMYYRESPSSAGSWKGEEFSSPDMIHPIGWFSREADAKPEVKAEPEKKVISGEKNAPYPSITESKFLADTAALGQDTGNESFIKGTQGRTYRTELISGSDDFKIIGRISEEATPLDKAMAANDFAQAEVAKHRSAVATLGYDPNKVIMEKKKLNIGGMYDKYSDRMLYSVNNEENQSALIHESIHRGFKKIMAQSEEGKKLLTDSGIPEELFVRYIMATKMGDPENIPKYDVSVKQRDQAMAFFKKYPSLTKDLDRLEEIAADLVKEKKPRGPN